MTAIGQMTSRGIRIEGSNIYVTPKGIRLTSAGKVRTDEGDVGDALASVDKGTARRIRKILRNMGLTHLAAARREMRIY